MTATSTFEISASLYFISHEEMHRLACELFEAVHATNQGFLQYEIEGRSENAEARIETHSAAGSSWSFNSNFKGSEVEQEEFVERMEKAFLEKDVLYIIEHFEVDEEDEPIGEEKKRIHPEFDERYTPPED